MISHKGKRFRDAMKEVPTSVSVILASSGGKVWGCTISSLVSVDVSEFSPKLLFVLSENSTIGKLIREKVSFSVNLLSEDMEDLATSFSSVRESFLEESIPDSLRMWEKVPIIRGAPVVFACQVVQVIKDYSSSIYISQVSNFEYNDASSPLLYQNRAFFKICRESKHGA